MEKDFDIWNDLKKDISSRSDRVLYHKRDVRWCKLGINVGYEQDGTGRGYARPVLVIKDFNAHVCLVVPLTTSKKENPYHVSVGIVGDREAFAIISQIRLVDTKRLTVKICVLDESVFSGIIKAIKDML